MILHFYENIPEVGEELVIGNYKIKVLKATDMKLEEVELKRVQ
jgi:Mg2+/Co2+ transporter CorB